MSLDRYRRARMVVLHPSTSVHAAARAMADNHIGSVLIAEHQQILGIVTDRDLALEIVAPKSRHDPAGWLGAGIAGSSVTWRAQRRPMSGCCARSRLIAGSRRASRQSCRSWSPSACCAAA